MKILYTAFNGKTNSSKILLDNIVSENKLYLKNSFTTSVKQLNSKIKNNNYDLIVSFGQAPLDKDTIRIETRGNEIDYFDTDYDYSILKKLFDENGFNTIVSKNAGNYLCNNIYYNGLKYIKENGLKCKMIFIHIPKIANISNIELLANIISFNKMEE